MVPRPGAWMDGCAWRLVAGEGQEGVRARIQAGLGLLPQALVSELNEPGMPLLRISQGCGLEAVSCCVGAAGYRKHNEK